ncbi:prephenate/arogenate dehydrogenase family protein [Aestuariivirga litoralis]|uniref:prephenate/arogenate dehydrogenase family protein n=1 Tax=Aestuariivirga litoralis TaxID=2650924 RepID=UPI0018C7C401|nr:prephenate/arogenate dehydrogenase family protein [Aestuariivirga litoralis]MBG1233710.1 prephenate/arogenate dehydrogenase family protein [Aestuariivirga litoralis]
MSIMFEKVALLGLGLIGSSICHGIRAKGLARHISGHARSAETRAVALEIKLVDDVHVHAADAVKDADLVILCAPVGACAALAKEIGPHLKAGAIVTDVGSVKGAIARDCGPFIPQNVHFIPGHPVAGTEQSGPRAGFAELFHGRWCILTPLPGADSAAVAKLTQFWEGLGSMVDTMEVGHHDLVLAITSHLPHLIAYNTVATAADLETVTDSEVIKYSASGFRDFTRIAASDPTMWRDVFLNNKEAVLEMLGRFSEELAVLQRAVRWGDGDTLFNLFTRAREVRRGIIAAGQDTAAPDFGRGHKPK